MLICHFPFIVMCLSNIWKFHDTFWSFSSPVLPLTPHRSAPNLSNTSQLHIIFYFLNNFHSSNCDSHIVVGMAPSSDKHGRPIRCSTLMKYESSPPTRHKILRSIWLGMRSAVHLPSLHARRWTVLVLCGLVQIITVVQDDELG